MTEKQNPISAEYSSILTSFLSKPGEAGLQQGYEFGRKAIEEHLGLLQIIDIYHNALNENLTRLSPESAKIMTKVEELLSASLAPFEMTHRGYQESVLKLQQLNRELEHRTEDLAAANEELQAFSYSVSHDLRAPLRGINGFSSILLKDHAAHFTDEAKALLSRIISSAQHMERLIEGLLNLSRLGRKELSYREVDLTAITNEILVELQRTNPERNVSVLVVQGAKARGDQELLQAVMTNLLANAWKFTSKRMDAVIEFGIIFRKEKPVYFVKDNGVGFDMTHAEKLFSPFQRFHSQDQFAGTGIGLSTVRRIITRHGGHIWAESEVDRGATFYFTL